MSSEHRHPCARCKLRCYEHSSTTVEQALADENKSIFIVPSEAAFKNHRAISVYRGPRTINGINRYLQRVRNEYPQATAKIFSHMICMGAVYVDISTGERCWL